MNSSNGSTSLSEADIMSQLQSLTPDQQAILRQQAEQVQQRQTIHHRQPTSHQNGNRQTKNHHDQATGGSGNSASSSDVAPKPVGGEAQPAAGKSRFTKSEQQQIDALLDIYNTAASIVINYNPIDAAIIASRTQQCAESHILLARQNAAYKKFLAKITVGSGYTAIFMAHVPIILAIMANHKLMPDFRDVFQQQQRRGAIEPNTATSNPEQAAAAPPIIPGVYPHPR